MDRVSHTDAVSINTIVHFTKVDIMSYEVITQLPLNDQAGGDLLRGVGFMAIITLKQIKRKGSSNRLLNPSPIRRQGDFPLTLIFSYIPKDSELIQQSCNNKGYL